MKEIGKKYECDKFRCLMAESKVEDDSDDVDV